MSEFHFSFELAFSNLLLMGLAFLLALPTAWNREFESKSAGLRTYPLVSMSCCAFMLIAMHSMQDDQAISRVFQGIVGGMGFIGGGAILKRKGSAAGTATAASLWGTGAIGIAVAWQYYEIAAMVSLISYLILRYLKQIK